MFQYDEGPKKSTSSKSTTSTSNTANRSVNDTTASSINALFYCFFIFLLLLLLCQRNVVAASMQHRPSSRKEQMMILKVRCNRFFFSNSLGSLYFCKQRNEFGATKMTIHNPALHCKLILWNLFDFHFELFFLKKNTFSERRCQYCIVDRCSFGLVSLFLLLLLLFLATHTH